jgi:hypothetical protein
MKTKLVLILVITVMVPAAGKGQDSTRQKLTDDVRARIQWGEDSYLDLNFYIQFWNVVSLDYAGLDVAPRYDMFIRRGRLGVSGRWHQKLFYQMSFAYDGVGKDSFSQSAGIPNQEDNTTFFPRDLLVSYAFHPLLHVTMGYFRPKVGKESIYSSSFCISQEKSWASFQPRIHIVGRGIGRETGVNLGGLWLGKKRGILYDVGFFDTNHPLIVGENSLWSPLLTGRLVAYLGDPEYNEYPMAYVQSGFGKRKGLSLGINGSYQGRTEMFTQNTFAGVDAQLNYQRLDLILEYNLLHRNTSTFARTEDAFFTFKTALNFIRSDNTIIQPCLMYSSVRAHKTGTEGKNDITGAISQHVWGGGVNWLINKDRFKLGLHYYRGSRLTFPEKPIYSYVNGSLQFMM